jgi:hypothetical protein
MKEVAWLAEVPLPGQRNPSQSHFSCVTAVSAGPGSSSTVSGREEGEREREMEGLLRSECLLREWTYYPRLLCPALLAPENYGTYSR